MSGTTESTMMIRVLAVALSLAMLATPASAARKAKPKAEPKDAPQAETENKPKAEPKNQPAYRPRTVDFDKLPKPIRALHACAKSGNKVEIGSVRYGKATLFIVSCPAPRGKLTPLAVYVAGNSKGRAAKRVTFEALAPDGGAASFETLNSAIPAREAYSKPGDPMPNMHSKPDVIWISGAWGPEDRAGVCAISASWRVQGDKGELMLWEQAGECPPSATPKYQTKVDKKPPPLVEP